MVFGFGLCGLTFCFILLCSPTPVCYLDLFYNWSYINSFILAGVQLYYGWFMYVFTNYWWIVLSLHSLISLLVHLYLILLVYFQFLLQKSVYWFALILFIVSLYFTYFWEEILKATLALCHVVFHVVSVVCLLSQHRKVYCAIIALFGFMPAVLACPILSITDYPTLLKIGVVPVVGHPPCHSPTLLILVLHQIPLLV